MYSLGVLTGLLVLNTAKASEAQPVYDLERELRHARWLGIPTTLEELKRTLPEPPADQNAAEFYRQLPLRSPDLRQARRLIWWVNWEPSAEVIAQAKAKLNQHDGYLRLASQIGSRPRFWMDRTWNDGHGLLYREITPAHGLVDLLVLRGAIAAQEGRVEDALTDARIIDTMVHHYTEESIGMGVFMARNFYIKLLRTLMTWSFRYRNEPRYPEFLKKVLDSSPPVDMLRNNRHMLLFMLRGIEQVQTVEGRTQLGFEQPEEKIEVDPSLRALFGPAEPREVSVARAVRGVRHYWRSLETNDERRAFYAKVDIFSGLVQIPGTLRVEEFGIFSERDPFDERRFLLEANGVARLFLEAASLKFPRRMSTEAFVSAADGRPIRYRSDGKSIRIDGGQFNEETLFVVELPVEQPKP